MSIFAELKASIASDPPATGHIVAELDQSCQLSRGTADGVRTCQYELIGFPEGYPCPSGWTTSGTRYQYSGETPTAFTLSLPGKYLPRLRLNGVGDDDTTGQLDTSLGVEVYHASGARSVVKGELDQFGGVVQTLNVNAALLSMPSSRITLFVDDTSVSVTPGQYDQVLYTNLTSDARTCTILNAEAYENCSLTIINRDANNILQVTDDDEGLFTTVEALSTMVLGWVSEEWLVLYRFVISA